ncbi:MAG: hypothetical protein KF689_04450 [Gemmatimonadaceae bacterium]|nr:hypothetical protein [Gemmatimonadaceae bacterium]MCW5825577.1 hypothetical protein [Gemmatimonadaceae bacterium]
MSILLWILQAALAFLYLAGGAYKTFKSADLVATIPSLPLFGWKVFGLIEVAGALLLILPPLLGRGQALTPAVAAALAVETLLLAALYARQSLSFSAENPLVWALAMGLIAALLAYGRYAQGAAA